jgi:drug/metabolite transporter (DMT)-like permease
MTEAGSTLSRPRGPDAGFLAIAVLSVSTSGPIIAAASAPKLGIALWRNVFACLLLIPLSLSRRVTRRELASLRQRGPQRMAVPGGLLLALHFGTWVPSLGLTSVASATALVTTQPIWSALIARARGDVLPRQAWLGMGVAIGGVIFVTGVDVNVSARAVAGDLLALVAAMFAAAYTYAGSSARQVLSTTSYTTVCYGVCGLALLVVCLVGGVQLDGYSAHDWWLLVALTAGPQLLGHSLINRVLRAISPTVVAIAILLEVPGAVLVAWAWPGQTPRLLAVPGILLMMTGILVVLRAGNRQDVLPLAPE